MDTDQAAKTFTSAQILRTLLKADEEFDRAQDALCQAKRDFGKDSVNPLTHNHPTVLAKRDAVRIRYGALQLARAHVEHLDGH